MGYKSEEVKKDVIESVINTVEQNLLRYEETLSAGGIVLGLSGGPDSTCLFDVLLTLGRKMNFSVHPVHINHGLRGDNADEDELYCQMICDSNGLDLRTLKIDCAALASASGRTVEEQGRIERYGMFSKVADEVGASIIAVAHNADDVSETVLIRMIRGTGIRGLSGIPSERDDDAGHLIVRPMINLLRTQIDDYCEQKNLNPRVDETNFKTTYTRNKVRLELMPELEKYNPKVGEALRRLAESAKISQEYIDSVAEDEFLNVRVDRGNDEGVLLDRNKLICLHEAIRHRIFELALIELGVYDDMTSSNFKACERTVLFGGPSASIDLPNNIFLSNVYGNVLLGKRSFGDNFDSLELKVNSMTLREYEAYKPSKISGVFDEDKLNEYFNSVSRYDVKLRGRRSGDVLKKRVGTSKVQDMLVDMKVPKLLRDEVMVVAIGSDVMMMIPTPKIAELSSLKKVKYSEIARVSQTTKNVVCIELIQGI